MFLGVRSVTEQQLIAVCIHAPMPRHRRIKPASYFLTAIGATIIGVLTAFAI